MSGGNRRRRRGLLFRQPTVIASVDSGYRDAIVADSLASERGLTACASLQRRKKVRFVLPEIESMMREAGRRADNVQISALPRFRHCGPSALLFCCAANNAKQGNMI
jgi:hypothetical protein